MPYEVIAPDTVTVHKQTAPAVKNPITGEEIYETESVSYEPGAVIEDEDVAPHVVKAYDDGEEHVRSLLKRVGEDKKASADKSKQRSAVQDKDEGKDE